MSKIANPKPKPKLTQHEKNKLKLVAEYLALPLGIMTFLGTIGSFWVWMGWPWLVSDHTLENKITGVKTEITAKTNEVMQHSTVNKQEVTKDIVALKKQALEGQIRNLYFQKILLESQRAGMEAEYHKSRSPLLAGQITEKKNTIDYLDRDMQNVQAQLQRLNALAPQGN